MECKVLISPFAKQLRNGKRNPKNYPHWDKVIKLLQSKGIYVVQLGVVQEPLLEADEYLLNADNKTILEYLGDTDSFISVDTFLPHFAHYHGIHNGVVLWGASDPKIFGYPGNSNLLKSREFLRPDQYGIWESLEYRPEIFVYPEVVVDETMNLLKNKTR